jgi:hypothetical protein
MLPYVLAGPILRKVTPKSVTVWLALRMASKVILTVQDEQQNKVMEGSRDTIAIGKNLHIVAVTATGDLTEGIVYRYNLEFQFENLNTNLFFATASADLGYPSNTLPSFALPPKDPNLLRLLQGSCRMPHAEGKDTFPLVDDLIAETAANAFARPHQLLLTGDQIYADDVADTLLLMLTDAGDTLLGWPEILPPDGTLPAQLPPYWREGLLKQAGFPSVDLRSHLLSLGEYLSMYLFVWSDVLWPAPSELPTVDELLDKVQPPVGTAKFKEVTAAVASRIATIASDTAAIYQFRSVLPKVRRALANIPSYMIFDDHEVTDDWNMTRNICRNLYGKPLGQRVVRNALIAYALCQHWGNAPEQFAASTPALPGLDLLRRLDTPNPAAANAFDQKAANLVQHSGEITALLGLHDDTVLAGRPHSGLFHESHSLQYHYTVEGEGHQVIFTDTRTWRSFPNGGDETSEIFPKEQFKHQILETEDTGDRVLLVVLSTNAPAVPPIRVATKNAPLSWEFSDYPDIYEAWEIPSRPFDRLLKTITDKLPLDSNRRRVGQAILLSGDVHMSFATRLIYRATERFEDVTPQPAIAVFAQLVASSFKKQNGDTRGFHREGYTHVPTGPKIGGLIAGIVIPPIEAEGYIGWNKATTPDGLVVGKERHGFIPYDIKFNKDEPTMPLIELLRGARVRSVEPSITPHYSYRLDYLLPTAPTQIQTPHIPALSGGTNPEQRKKAAETFHTASAATRIYNLLAQPKVVGVNNFGEITFIWPPNSPDKKVNHTLRWRDSAGNLALTTYTVRLTPEDHP